MEIIILAVHVLVAVGIVTLVLIQHGKGADVGAAFGTGSAGSVFGSAGSANFLSRLTAVLAVAFFLSSMGLTWISTKRVANKGVMAAPAATQSAPDKAPGVPGAPGVPTAPASKSDKSDVPVPAAPAGGSKTGDASK